MRRNREKNITLFRRNGEKDLTKVKVIVKMKLCDEWKKFITGSNFNIKELILVKMKKKKRERESMCLSFYSPG